MFKKRSIAVTLFFITFIMFSGCGQKQTEPAKAEPEFILTYAENHPANYPTTKGAEEFARLVEERTNGKIRIQVKDGGEFGTQQQMVNQMKFGGIDFARVSVSSLSDELPQLNVLQLPFLYEDSEHMWRVLEGEIGDQFMELVYEINLVPLSWYDAGARSFYSVEKPVKTVEDIEGMTIRVQESQMMRDMISLLGGNPVDLAYSEVYSALETGEIDAAENNWSSYRVAEHCKVAKYYTLDEHTRVPELQLASGNTWSKLPEEYREIILECAKESSEYERMLWKEQEQLSRTESLAQGSKEIRISGEELQKFRDKVMPLYEEYCSGYMDIIEEIKKQSNAQ